jgi:hypothetical protein
MKFMLRSSEMTLNARYRVGTGANEAQPRCLLGNDWALLRSDHQAGLIISEQNNGLATAPYSDTDPPYQLGVAAITLARRVDVHSC